jgi:hypothetical protein
MPQRFYFDEKDLDGTVNKLDRNLMEMLDFAYLHEDMVNTIEQLMSDWGKENMPSYSDIIEEYENMPEDQKEWYDDVDEYLSEFGRWWMEDFGKLDDEMKVRFIERYRLTIASCLFSDTYNYETLMSEINESFDHMMA